MTALRLVLVVAAAVLLCIVGPRVSSACSPPEPFMEVEATVPGDGATDVALSPTIAVHFAIEQSYDYDQFRAYDESPFRLTVTDLDGNEVAAGEMTVESAVESEGRALMTWLPGELVAETTYQATLERGDKSRHWTFTTGDGDLPPYEAPTSLEIDLDGYFAERPVTSCCPIDTPGQCPTCFTIGYEPVATLNAGFDLLEHPAGPGAFVYTMQTRVDVDGASWENARSVAFSGGESLATIELVHDRFQTQDTCVRVVAHSVVAPALTYESNEECRGADHFSDPPPAELDRSQMMCDETDDEVEDDPDDGTSDGDTGDEEDEETTGNGDEEVSEGDPADDELDTEDSAGWEFSEDADERAADTGCGCSSGGSPQLPGAVAVLLLFFAVGRARRRASAG